MTERANVPTLPEGPVTIMFTDIEGSTSLRTSLGDAETDALFRQHDEIVRALVAEHNGYDQHAALGDGFLVVFVSTKRALACAIAIQRALARRNADRPDCPLAVRMGLHCGPALRRGTDFFGRNVVVAARIAAQARGGEILASAELCELVGITDGELSELALKGLRGTQRVHAVAWAPDSVVTEGDLVQRERL